MDTNGISLCLIVFDFSGESSSNRLTTRVYTGFTRQGSEVQILSRLPGKTRKRAVHWMAFLLLRWEAGLAWGPAISLKGQCANPVIEVPLYEAGPR